MKHFDNVFQGKRVLVTGHTGFKGSWLSLWLDELGASVSGIALPPKSPISHWDTLKLKIADHRENILNFNKISELINKINPEIVFHLAAQSLVRESYSNPLETWSTNTVGTANILEACRQNLGVKTVVVATTDKCYENREWEWGYRENDQLGGHDPYSASKAACELLVSSYRNSYFSDKKALQLASVRAGNVIGGGDWSKDRLIPDLVLSTAKGIPLRVRSPNATRPWQHVLDCLSGYLTLAQKLHTNGPKYATAWNFGPSENGNHTVKHILEQFKQHWPQASWISDETSDYHEAKLLYVDSSRARSKLGWKPVWSIEDALQHTANWYRRWYQEDLNSSQEQLKQYVADAAKNSCNWVTR